MRHLLRPAACLFTLLLAFRAAPAAHDGVPRIDPDYRKEVQDWWASHPFNPESPRYDPEIRSPEPVVTLKRGDSIQDAIDELPSAGGTIRLTRGDYDGYRGVGRSNVHVLGEEGVVVRGAARYAGSAYALNYGDYDKHVSRRGRRKAEYWEAHKNPTRNFYVRDVTFDGGGTLVSAVGFQRVYDAVLDRCTFRNFRNPRRSHPGTVWGHEGLNNIWVRDSKFLGACVYACYLDGAHGCGMINNTVDLSKYNGGFLYLTNDDFTEDINESGKTDREEERTAKYIVIYGNTYNGNASQALQVTGENILFASNIINGNLGFLVGSDPRWTDSDPEIRYHFYNFRIVNNTVNGNLATAVLFSRNLAEISCPPNIKHPPRMGKATIEGNTINGTCPQMLKEITLPHPNLRKEGKQEAEFDGPNVVRDNVVKGQAKPSS